MTKKGGTPENLTNLRDRTPEERVAIASAGGKASVEAKRKKKAMREAVEMLLSLPSKNKKALNQLKAMGIDPEDADNQMVMLTAMYAKACSGDVFAANFLRDTGGEKPTDKHAFDVDDGLLGDILQQLDGGDAE